MSFPTPTPSITPTAVGPVVRTIRIGHESAIDCGDYVLVASTSESDAWHVVTTNPLSCTCSGFFYRSTCKHLQVALQVQMAGIESAKPVVDQTECVEIPFAAIQAAVPTGKACLALMSLES